MRRAAKSNLRRNAGKLVGRARELGALQELLERGARCVSICGPAGTGKTRLAEAFGARLSAGLQATGEGGVWMVALASARTVESVVSAIERTLGVPPGPDADADAAVARLGAAIAARGPIVLILDNVEQVLDDARAPLQDLLALAPDLRLVLTSREPLRTDDESRFPLSPLSLPEPSATDPTTLLAAESVLLLVGCVRRSDPSFAITAENGAEVSALVHRLDGLPLAIELAASRVEMLGLSGLLTTLADRFDVLAQSGPSVHARHATLSAAIEWSWDLLDDNERDVLARCAVFRGGFTAQAAADVLGERGTPAMDALQSLREKSLLQREEAPGSGAPRFRLFHSVRTFAADHLDADLWRATADAHAEVMLAQAEPWAAAIGQRDSVAALEELEGAAENLEAAHAHTLARVQAGGDVAHASSLLARLTLCLHALATVRGSASEHRRVVEDSLGALDLDALDPLLTIRALRARGALRLRQGQSTTALRDLDRALQLAEAEGRAAAEAEVLIELALHHHHRRELSSARVLYERALAKANASSATAIEGRVRGNLGALHHDSGRFEEASTHYRDALALLQTAGDQRLEAIHVANLGILEQERGDRPQARAHFAAARELLEALGDRRLLAIVEGNVGNLEHEGGDATEARACHERALALLRESGDRRSEALCLGRLARANASLAWLDDARGCLRAADHLLGRYPDPLVRAAIEVDRGFLDLAGARQARAARDEAEFSAAKRAAAERIKAASEPRDDALPWIAISDDIRTTVRTLQAELDNIETAQSGGTGATRPALVIGTEAKWMRPPDKDAQDLRRRKSLRFILAALTQQHREAPGVGIPLDGLLAAGWPGERVVATAGANRVYVALTTLRKLGLRGLLLSQDDGYLLDPALPIERSERSWDALQG